MKKIFLILFTSLVIISCKKEESNVPAPSNVSALTVAPRVGGAVVKWTLPTDSNFLYLEVRYMKKDKLVKTNVSKLTDSVLITGLLNKLDYVFEVQAFNRDKDKVVGGEVLTTSSVKPIKRPVQVTYFSDQLTKVTVTDPMIQTFTQESSEGPKINLIDGNRLTYWHTAWSAGVQPLPHWVKIDFPEETSLGAIKYFFRNNTTVNGRPTQFALETSTDGSTWTRVWTSAPGLSTSTAVDQERTLAFDKNYTAKYHRVMITATTGNTTFVTLGDMSFYTMKQELTDLEQLAETNY